jgi:hypothetical protein
VLTAGENGTSWQAAGSRLPLRLATLCRDPAWPKNHQVVARVLWRDAQGIEGSVDLGAVEIRIGRAMDCAIRTDDAMVSRHHARLFWGGHGYLLEDLGSANGVYYQEQKVHSHLLKHGDAVRCGSLWLRFVDTGQLAQQGGHQGMSVEGAPLPMSNQRASSQPPVQAPPPPSVPQVPAVPPSSGPVAGVQGGHGSPSGHGSQSGHGAQSIQSDEELKRLRRRVEQLQTELRMVRGSKMGSDKARRMEDLESEVETLRDERDQLKSKVGALDDQLQKEAGSAKVQKAVEIRGKAAEIVTALNDLLSSLRIEVMAAEGEFDQYSHSIPRASFELIRQSMRESASNVDQARDLLRQLRDVAS